MWKKSEQRVGEVKYNWGVLMLKNVTQSTEYTCRAEPSQNKKVFSITTVGELLAVEFCRFLTGSVSFNFFA